MSNYKYILHDYHAIKSAEIKIDGITVLSGINGCGKSTLSRWLYYIINGNKGYDLFLTEEFKEKVSQILQRIYMACRDLDRYINRNSSSNKPLLESLSDKIRKIGTTKIHSSEQIDLIQELFFSAYYTALAYLQESLTEDISEVRKHRLYHILNLNSPKNIQQALESFEKQNDSLMHDLIDKLYFNQGERPVMKFYNLINKYFEIEDETPKSIQLEEDNVNIIEEGHIAPLFGLRQAIYIDTPMAIGLEDTDNPFWMTLRTLINNDKQKRDLSPNEKKLLFRIKELLGGEVILEEKSLFEEKELYYVSQDGNVKIPLKNAATGFKTLSYLQRLLEEGFLNSETLLMIDEPEAHLHPQWVVEFARLLVLMNKELGLKIIIASHNPDMVAAIHDIAYKEGIINSTNFYVAQPDSPQSYQYVYKDLKHEIGEIFESFNIALENINRYGN